LIGGIPLLGALFLRHNIGVFWLPAGLLSILPEVGWDLRGDTWVVGPHRASEVGGKKLAPGLFPGDIWTLKPPKLAHFFIPGFVRKVIPLGARFWDQIIFEVWMKKDAFFLH
jgi:hypothetical protein